MLAVAAKIKYVCSHSKLITCGLAGAKAGTAFVAAGAGLAGADAMPPCRRSNSTCYVCLMHTCTACIFARRLICATWHSCIVMLLAVISSLMDQQILVQVWA